MPQQSSQKITIGLMTGAMLACVMLLVGLWCFLHPGIYWMYGLLWSIPGVALLYTCLLYLYLPPYLSAHALERRGIGLLVHSTPKQHGSFQCQQCHKTSRQRPFLRGESIFCSLECEKITRPATVARPKLLLSPPLYTEELHKLLEQAIQLAERAMNSASDNTIDRPLLKAMRRGHSASLLILKVVTSLLLWGEEPWAKRLYQVPPPEPTLAGGSTGTPRFFQVARNLQQYTLEMEFGEDPFETLQRKDPLDKEELQQLKKTTLTPPQQKALAKLEAAFATLEELTQQSSS